MKYEYWEHLGKEQSISLEQPKCIKVMVSASRVYWKCRTCGGEDTIYKMRFNGPDCNKLLDRCSYCGQRIYLDWEEVKKQSYYIKACARAELVVKREKDLRYKIRVEELRNMLINRDITKEKYDFLIKIAKAEVIGDFNEEVHRLENEMKQKLQATV